MSHCHIIFICLTLYFRLSLFFRYVDFVQDEIKKCNGDEGMINMLTKQLGLDPDYVEPENDSRLLNVQSITIEFKEHKVDQVLPFSTDAEQKAAAETVLTVKEGVQFRVKVTFRGQHYIINDLKLKSTIKKFGKTVAEDEEMLGSYNPTTNFKDVYLPSRGYNDAPSGMLGRGTYGSTMTFTNDKKETLLTINYKTAIAKAFAE